MGRLCFLVNLRGFREMILDKPTIQITLLFIVVSFLSSCAYWTSGTPLPLSCRPERMVLIDNPGADYYPSFIPTLKSVFRKNHITLIPVPENYRLRSDEWGIMYSVEGGRNWLDAAELWVLRGDEEVCHVSYMGGWPPGFVRIVQADRVSFVARHIAEKLLEKRDLTQSIENSSHNIGASQESTPTAVKKPDSSINVANRLSTSEILDYALCKSDDSFTPELNPKESGLLLPKNKWRYCTITGDPRLYGVRVSFRYPPYWKCTQKSRGDDILTFYDGKHRTLVISAINQSKKPRSRKEQEGLVNNFSFEYFTSGLPNSTILSKSIEADATIPSINWSYSRQFYNSSVHTVQCQLSICRLQAFPFVNLYTEYVYVWVLRDGALKPFWSQEFISSFQDEAYMLFNSMKIEHEP